MILGMGGYGTSGGMNYQAGVIAYVYSCMLALRRLDWLRSIDDTPEAVSGETGGPGDDVRVETSHGAFEVQAKAGLTGEADLREAIQGILGRAPGDAEAVVLAVDRRSSGWIYRDLATDLERLRRGRSDVLVRAGRLYSEFGDALQRIQPVAVDVSPPEDYEAIRGRDLLASVLEDPNDAAKAWALIYEDAHELTERRFRRDRAGLVLLLARAGITVRRPTADEQLLAQLDWIEQLLEKRHAAAALSHLADLDRNTSGSRVDPLVRYRAAAHRARALLQLERPADALAAAKDALDIRRDGVEGLVWAARAALMGGDLRGARAYAQAAIAAAPGDPRAWATEAHVAIAADETPQNPPPEVASSNHYRTVLAELSLSRGDIENVLALTDAVLATGERPVLTLFVRAWALQMRLGGGSDPADIANEIERLMTEALGDMDDVHPVKPKALMIRAAAYQAVGDTQRAAEDLRLATTLDASDVDAVRSLVGLRIEAHDDEGALELLYGTAVGDDPVLLALRAQVLTRRQRREEALIDLERAVAVLGHASDSDGARFLIAEAAVDLAQPDLAAQMLEGLSSEAAGAAVAHALRGRVAFQRGLIDEGTTEFREAASVAEDDKRSLLLAELGARLARANRPEESADVFREIPGEELPPDALSTFVGVLMRLNRLPEAQRELDAVAKRESLSPSLLSVAVQIALARDDPASAIAHLGELVERGEGTLSARATLAQLLIEEGRTAEAERHVAELEASEHRSPVETMQLAELLRELGRGDDAIRFAYAAFRLARDDPRMHRALVGLVFASRIPIEPAEEVGPDTYVRLRGEHGEQRDHVVLSEPPFHPGENELSLEAANTAGLVGKRVGDTVTEHPDSAWRQKTWTVEEIVPAVVHYARDAMARYQDRFPDEPEFATSIYVGDGNRPGDYVRLIQALQERRESVDRSIAILREQLMPLGLIAEAIGAPIADFMDAARARPDDVGPLWVEWDNEELQGLSTRHAREADALILTESALKTLFDLDIQGVVRDAYRLVAPRSLLIALRRQLADARDQLTHGSSTMASGDIPIQIDDIPPGDPRLAARVDRLESVMTWLDENVRFEPRPLESVHPQDSEPSSLREMLGNSSFDAVVLSQTTGIPMYADDLGLRRLALGNDRPASVSSVTVVPVLAERGYLDTSARDSRLLDLVLRDYRAVMPSADLLLAAVRRIPRLSDEELLRVCSTFGLNVTSPANAATTVASALRRLAMEPVVVVPPEKLALFALRGLAARVPRPFAAALLWRAAGDALMLFPVELEAVRQVCSRFAGGT